MRWLYFIPVVIFLGVAGIAGYFLLTGENPQDLPSALINQPVPATDLAVLGDGSARLTAASFSSGKITLVNFFASWCVPCRAEHAQLMSLSKQQHVALAGIAWKDKPEDAQSFLHELGNPFVQVALDTSGRTGIDWGVYGVPETFVIDGAGKIRYRHVGPIMPQDMDQIHAVLRRIEP